MKISRHDDPQLCLGDIRNVHPFQFHHPFDGTDPGRVYVKVYPCHSYNGCAIIVDDGKSPVVDLEQGNIKPADNRAKVKLLDYDFIVKGDVTRRGSTT